MKAAPFAYHRPASVADAVETLAGGDAKVLAGGQSLVPVLAMRLGRPGTLVDIAALPELGRVERRGETLHIGAAVRQRRVERDPLTAAVPLIGRAMPFVGHRELRSRGTVCGSLAHADPAAELPAVAACLGAVVEVTGPRGDRDGARGGVRHRGHDHSRGRRRARHRRPVPDGGSGRGLRVRRDRAAARGLRARRGRGPGPASAGGGVRDATLAAFGVSDRPVLRDVTELLADAATEADLRPATDALAREVVDTAGDAHGSTAYRARLLGVLAARELARAHSEAVA